MEHLKVTFVGHVDHGKSTLIGRLLYDTGSIPPDRMEEIERISKELGKKTEFAFILDHLSEEREQSITIDTAQTFFKTEHREYVIIDAPGHKEFLKNMITGASQAEAAVLMLDVSEGVREQTRRHAYLLGLLGLRQSIVAVNKMDKVGYDQAEFTAARDALLPFLAEVGVEPSAIVPVSAAEGDNVVTKSGNMPWYDGPAVIEALDSFVPVVREERPVRYSVQDVYPYQDSGIFAGRVEAGMIKKGMILKAFPEENTVKVTSVREFTDEIDSAGSGKCVGLLLEPDTDVGPGSVLADPEHAPRVTDALPANVFWLDPVPLKRDETLTLRLATQGVKCRVEKIETRIDSSSLQVTGEDVSKLSATEVGQVILRTEKPLVFEDHTYLPELGRFVLERGLAVVAGGIVAPPKSA